MSHRGIIVDGSFVFFAPRDLRGVLCEEYNDGWKFEGTEPDPKRWQKFDGPPCTGKAGHYYLRNGFNWMEDGEGNAWFNLQLDKGMRDYLVKLHVNTARGYSPRELEALRVVEKHRLPGWRQARDVVQAVREVDYLRRLRRKIRYSFLPSDKFF